MMADSTEAQGPSREIADMQGTEALPRKNGELVFDAAWEARVFGMTISMHERNLFEWNEFRDELIEEIGEADRSGSSSTYYERWLEAFEHLLVEKGLVSQEELDARLAEFTSGQRDDAF
ncbi:MAG: nitrile hydratase accessory protein [Chloroflexi bacterium]|nr:nitrile hydratase accessory protein [Chloroflexota bacterium]